MDRVRNRFNEYSRNRRQASPRELKYGRDRDEQFYEYRQPYFDRGERRNEPRGSEGREREARHRERYNEPYRSRYGEHPASRGREEYRGNNKRRSGLGDSRPVNRQATSPYARREEDNRFRRPRRNGRRSEPRHIARREYDEYLGRGQYETPFHQRDIYDPVELEYRNEYLDRRRDLDHLYQDEGYQSRGRTDGFGRGGRRQSSNDWRYEDEYRHGHAMRRNGSGKYGAR